MVYPLQFSVSKPQVPSNIVDKMLIDRNCHCWTTEGKILEETEVTEHWTSYSVYRGIAFRASVLIFLPMNSQVDLLLSSSSSKVRNVKRKNLPENKDSISEISRSQSHLWRSYCLMLLIWFCEAAICRWFLTAISAWYSSLPHIALCQAWLWMSFDSHELKYYSSLVNEAKDSLSDGRQP